MHKSTRPGSRSLLARLNKLAAQPAIATAVKLSSPAGGVLQRQCSGGCGSHTVAGGQCDNCKKKKYDLQRELRVGEANDVFEQEADRIADRVLAAPAGGRVNTAPLRVQRFTGTPGGDPVAAPPSVDRTLSASGHPLATPLRRDMEQRFGHDFSRVRVHSDSSAAKSAAEINANAYTVGPDVVFGAGRFRPGTHEGRRLLAHELTHVVQQRGGDNSAVLHKQSNVIQRDVDEEGIETGEVTPTTTTPGSPTEFGPTTTEPGCPRVPTGLSDLRPDPPCPSAEEPVAGRHFQFCTDSDVFRDAMQLPNLRSFARSQRADSIFKIHGYASTDGSTQGNLNLSCHRAKRTARELENAGVPSQQIRMFAHGETALYGPQARDNQIALVGAEAPEGQTTPTSTPATSLRDAIDQAVARIIARDYRLAADAYISRWTCGRIPNLAEMVRRTTILIEGEAGRTRINRDVLNPVGDPRLGHPNLEGLHEIVLANETFSEASDPVLCAAARIVDMAFHHFLAPQLGVGPNDSPVHRAALFLVGLAGFPPCETVTGNIPGTTIPAPGGGPWWTTPSTDPLAGRTTGCADQPLPGPIDTTQLPARPERPPTFNVTDPRPETGRANIPATLDPTTNRLTVTPPERAIAMAATVGASGDPAVVSRYQVGWMHTVVADEMVVNYVGGQRVRREVPVPMRARSSPSSADVPPWSNPGEVRTASHAAPVTTSFTAAPPATMEFLFEDPALRTPANRGTSLGQPENPINTAEVHTTFNAWVVARRDDAPLDRFSTHFLQGHEANLTINVDVVGEETSATYASEIALAPPLTDATPMQLRGSTEDLVASDDRIVEVAAPTPRGEVTNGMTVEQVRARVRQVGDDLAPLREALHLDGSIMVRVRFDRNTGRMIIDTDERPSTIVEETGPDEDREGVPNSGLRELGRAFTARLRKELVLAPGLHETVPTAFNAPLPSYRVRRARRGSPDPFAFEHGIGPVGEMREQTELNRSAEQLRDQPRVYDPTFWPDVQVELARERYCYNFRISGIDIDQVCVDPTMRTEGCVRPFSADTYDLISTPRFVTQQLAGQTFESPVALRVTTFPMSFVMFTPSENPGGDTFNHEMHHMIDCFNEVHTMKERMARSIRARLMEIRRLAAENPQLRASLLSRRTIFAIVEQENKPFEQFFQREFLRRGDVLHTRESREGLPPYRTELPANWTTFRQPPLRGGTAGSFDDQPCSF